MASPLRNFISFMSRKSSRNAGGYRWFQVWIALGLVLAILLLASSISTYVLVSRRLVVDHLRSEMAAQVANLDREIQRGAVRDSAQLTALLHQFQERSNGRIASIRIENDGATVAQAGGLEVMAFSNDYVRAHLPSRQPIFTAVNSSAGRILVEVFPFRLAGPLAAPMGPPMHIKHMRHPFSTLEMAVFLDGNSTPLWPLKRNLMINSSAALALLMSLTVIALRLRAYVAGRQLEQEVEIARTVQRDLLPSASRKLEGFELAADCVPATRVSGDFFDTFPGRAGRPAFVLGDVSGKGVPAALLMGVIHGAVRSSGWTESAMQHAEAAQELNRLLYERAATERFATMFWSYFDPASQHLHYVNAGHCPPLLLKAAHRNTILRLAIGGPVLGLLPNAAYQNGSVRLDAGDILVLYSDGIVEAANSQDEEFGEQRIQAIVAKCRNKTAEQIRDEILSAVQAFTGRGVPEDDRTLCVIVYSGTATRAETSDTEADLKTTACAA